MRISKLLEKIPKTSFKIYGKKNEEVSSITDNSKEVEKGSLFVAIKGGHLDGHDFIAEAVFRGAVVVVGEKEPDNKILDSVTYVKVADTRQMLSFIASAWYGNPSEKLKIIGVTGTDGKTTTANLIYWILKTAGKKVGLISTVSAKIGEKEYDTGFHVTNPEPIPLQKFLRLMVDKDCQWVVLEVTSHGLDQKRVAGIKFEVGVLTNITHEHLDYHKSLQNYIKAKSKLFTSSKVSVLNKDDDSFERVIKVINGSSKIVPYGYLSLKGKVKGAVQARFPEEYNQVNAAAAVTVAKILGIDEKYIVQSIKVFPRVPGRMEEIKNDKEIRIIIDFAHTPNALNQVLSTLKKQKSAGSRLIAVFGCAGERDTAKRPMMGEISARLADFSVFTAEDPRSEDASKIISQMTDGVKRVKGAKFYKIPERGEAISFAIQKIAEKGDIVVICGKGHEKSMAYGKREYPWSDHEAVRRSLTHTHFMGIGGSGISGVAKLASKMGYRISGCDLEASTAYAKNIYQGHSASHLKDVDLVVASPAVFYQSSKTAEFTEAKSKNILITWQEFVGRFLQKNKKVICIAGTHGKSTTTAMAGKLLEDAGLDPTVVLGANFQNWKGNSRYGRGDYFVIEADEFYDNFLNYHPMITIINNIEFDHPDYFKSEDKVFESFKKFISNLVGAKVLIVNVDSPGAEKLLGMINKSGLKIIDYSMKGKNMDLQLKVLGKHNIANALGVVALGRYLGIGDHTIKASLESFSGVERRLELIGSNNGIMVYDDYAHHPTEIAATLEGLRQKYSQKHIWAVVEAHGYARTHALLGSYKGVFKDADRVVIGPIFKARDTSTFGVNEKTLANAAKHKDIKNFGDTKEMFSYLRDNLKKDDIVLVMGAGKSYLWAREIANLIK